MTAEYEKAKAELAPLKESEAKLEAELEELNFLDENLPKLAKELERREREFKELTASVTSLESEIKTTQERTAADSSKQRSRAGWWPLEGRYIARPSHCSEQSIELLQREN